MKSRIKTEEILKIVCDKNIIADKVSFLDLNKIFSQKEQMLIQAFVKIKLKGLTFNEVNFNNSASIFICNNSIKISVSEENNEVAFVSFPALYRDKNSKYLKIRIKHDTCAINKEEIIVKFL